MIRSCKPVQIRTGITDGISTEVLSAWRKTRRS